MTHNVASVAIVFLGNRSLLSSEREALHMQVSARDACTAQLALEYIEKRSGTTQVYLAFDQIGDEFAQVRGRQQLPSLGRRVVTDDVVHGRPAVRREARQLVVEDQVFLGHDAV